METTKKQKKCTTCKKKNLKELEPLIEISEIDTPTLQDIKMAYAELTSYSGIKEDKKEFINKIYEHIFSEELDFKCRGCASTQVQKFTNYLNKNNIKV